MKKRVADLLRKWADRLDFAGAPKRTSWSFTIEDHAGVVFNQDGKGCPVWYYGDADYQLAHSEERWKGTVLETPEWVTIGFRVKGSGVLVLGSADLPESRVTRRMDGYDELAPFSGRTPYKVRAAKVPRWNTLLNCRMRTFVQVTGADYPSALKKLFDQGGRSG